MNARIQSVKDERHADADKLPRVSFWVPGSEIAEALKATATYIGGPATVSVVGKAGSKTKMVVLLKRVTFGGDKESVFDVDVEASKPFPVDVGDEVEIKFEGGKR